MMPPVSNPNPPEPPDDDLAPTPAPAAPPPDEEPEIPEPDVAGFPPSIVSYVKRLRRENQSRRRIIRELRAELETRKAAPAATPAAPDGEPGEPNDLEPLLQAETHKRLVAEVVADADTLNPKAARLLLSERTRVNSNGVLVFADDENETVGPAMARELLPLSLLRTKGNGGSGGHKPAELKPPVSADSRMILSQRAYEKMTPQERRAAEDRLRRGH